MKIKKLIASACLLALTTLGVQAQSPDAMVGISNIIGIVVLSSNVAVPLVTIPAGWVCIDCKFGLPAPGGLGTNANFWLTANPVSHTNSVGITNAALVVSNGFFITYADAPETNGWFSITPKGKETVVSPCAVYTNANMIATNRYWGLVRKTGASGRPVGGAIR